MWDVQQSQLLVQHKLIVNDHHISFSPNEEVMVTKNANGELVFFEPITGKVISSTDGFKYNHQGCQPQFSTDNISLIDGDNSGNLVVWDCRTAEQIHCEQFTNHMITDIRHSAVKNRFYVVVHPKVDETSGTKLLCYSGSVIDTEPVRILPDKKDYIDHEDWLDIETFEICQEGHELVLSLKSIGLVDRAQIVVLDVEGKEKSRSIKLMTKYESVVSLAVNRTVILGVVHTNPLRKGMNFVEKQEAMQTERCHIHVINRKSLELIKIIVWPDVCDLEFHPNGQGLAIASYSRSVYLDKWEDLL